MKKTKIDWADSTWNPVTGCLHGCEYCYARRIAERFGCASETNNDECCHECQWIMEGTGEIHDLNEPIYDFDNRRNAPYPFGFDPTFHRYRLDEPQRWKKPRTIFVCSMADLFGEWVPDEWIDDVIRATQKAIQHRYLFLTKNPERYGEWIKRFEESQSLELDEIQNCWFGASASNNEQLERANRSHAMWLSIEPIRERIYTDEDQFMQFRYSFGTEIEERRWQWVVIGAETGNSKGKVIPQKEWIMEIANVCREYGTPVFMKESLRELMGDDFRQEFPWREE